MAFCYRPSIKPWLPTVWRDPGTLQIGVDPSAGVLVSGVDTATADWLVGLDGSCTEAESLARAATAGLDVANAVAILSGLRRNGVLLLAPLPTEKLQDSGQLLPELVNLTATLDSPLRGSQALDARGQRHVVIDGANRIGVPLGALLAASGVGRLTFLDAQAVRRCDAGVGGLRLADEGVPRVAAARRAIRRISAVAEALGEQAPREADLLIRCQPWTAHDPLVDRGLSDRTAHLTVAVREGVVVIGPLVLPGVTSCLRCADLHRTDRDPRWPTVAAQLVAAPHRAMHEPSSVHATLAAALAAGQVLDFLDGTAAPAVIEATLELHPPDWQLHRRSWPPHADCGCVETVAEAHLATG